MADHEVAFIPVFGNSVWRPVCMICNGNICRDGYPERTDGEWMHMADWNAKHAPEWATITLTQKELNQKLTDSYNNGFTACYREMRTPQQGWGPPSSRGGGD